METSGGSVPPVIVIGKQGAIIEVTVYWGNLCERPKLINDEKQKMFKKSFVNGLFAMEIYLN